VKLSEIEKHLLKFTKEEELYREYHWLEKDPTAISKFIEGIDSKIMRGCNFFIPELAPRSDTDFSAEDWYWGKAREGGGINSAKDIYVHPHARYMPARPFFHSFYEMHYQYKGHSTIELKSHLIEMSEGDVCIIAPEVHHIVGAYNDQSIDIVVKIKKSTLKSSFPVLLAGSNPMVDFFISTLYAGKHDEYMYLPDRGEPEVKRLFSLIYLEHYNMQPFAKEIMNLTLAGLFFVLLRVSGLTGEDRLADVSARRMDEILDFIKDHHADITLRKLAQEFHFAEQYLSKYIKKHTGVTYSDIVRKIKLERSLELLDTTNMAIADISSMVGYSSPENFMRQFKRKYGISPTSYRKRGHT
jgi:AraC-like DNA-binding protein